MTGDTYWMASSGPTLAFPAMPFETATSYTSRLARFARTGDPFDLCLDLGMDWKSIVRGDVLHLQRLAALGGASFDDLDRWSIKAVGRLVFRIGDDIVPNKTLLRSRLRVCPACDRLRAVELPTLFAAGISRSRSVRWAPEHTIFVVKRLPEWLWAPLAAAMLTAAMDPSVSGSVCLGCSQALGSCAAARAGL